MENREGYVTVDMDARLRQLLEEIFTDAFMRENSNFENFEAFRYSSAVIADWNAPRLRIFCRCAVRPQPQTLLNTEDGIAITWKASAGAGKNAGLSASSFSL